MAAQEKYTPRFEEKYKKVIAPAMKESRGYKNPHEIHEGFMLSNQVILLHNSPSTGYRTYQLPIHSKLTKTYRQVA